MNDEKNLISYVHKVKVSFSLIFGHISYDRYSPAQKLHFLNGTKSFEINIMSKNECKSADKRVHGEWKITNQRE